MQTFFFKKFDFYFILEYSCYFQVYNKVIQLYVYAFCFRFFSYIGYYRIDFENKPVVTKGERGL